MHEKRPGPGSDGSEQPLGRFGAAGVNGGSPEGMHTRVVPIDDVPDAPVDLVAVQADDELISALAGGMAVSAPGMGGYDADDRVAAMLAAWKAEVDAEPLPEPVDAETAAAAVAAGRAPRRRARHLMPLASAAALIVVAVAGVSLGAQDAVPGDALWPVTKVLYQQHAESVEALAVVQQAQEKAREALAVGDKDGAAAALAEGKAAASVVLAEDGQGKVVEELQRLEVAVEETTPGVPNVVEPKPAEPAPPSASAAGGAAEEPGVGAQAQGPAQEPKPPAVGSGEPTGAATSPTETTDPATPPTTTSPAEEEIGGSTSTEQGTAKPGTTEPSTPPSSPEAVSPPQGDPSGISGASTSATGTATSAGEPPAPGPTS